MVDPFQDVSAAKPETIELIINGLEARGEDPETVKIVDAAREFDPIH